MGREERGRGEEGKMKGVRGWGENAPYTCSVGDVCMFVHEAGREKGGEGGREGGES